MQLHIIPQPVTPTVNLTMGSYFHSHSKDFLPIVEALGKYKVIGSDCIDWKWNDFFPNSQFEGGENHAKVEYIQVVNDVPHNKTLTLRLKYAGVYQYAVVILSYR